jgi:Apea-like HEPN
LKKRETIGAGFYLYLGVRRGEQNYIENTFVTLITGFEALHRKIINDSNATKIKDQVVRIVDDVKDKKDKKWLAGRLKHAHEPNLEKRLYDIFTSVDLGLVAKRLRKFASQCATIRNDLSHFGEQRGSISYQAFIRDVAIKNAALSVIYHAVILNEIGVGQDVIHDWLDVRSSSAKAYFFEAGLLDKRT